MATSSRVRKIDTDSHFLPQSDYGDLSQVLTGFSQEQTEIIIRDALVFSDPNARRGGFLTPIDFNPMEFGISPRDIEATDTSQLLGLVAAKQALTDARVDFKVTDRNRVSVILGVTGTLELVIPLGARLGHPKWKKAMLSPPPMS